MAKNDKFLFQFDIKRFLLLGSNISFFSLTRVFLKVSFKSPLDVCFHINNLDRIFFLGNNSIYLILLTFQLQTWTIVWCIEMDLQSLTNGSLPVFPIFENLSLRIVYSKTFKDVVCLCLEPERWAAVAVLWSARLTHDLKVTGSVAATRKYFFAGTFPAIEHSEKKTVWCIKWLKLAIIVQSQNLKHSYNYDYDSFDFLGRF